MLFDVIALDILLSEVQWSFLLIALLLWFSNILLWAIRSSSWDTYYFWLQIASELREPDLEGTVNTKASFKKFGWQTFMTRNSCVFLHVTKQISPCNFNFQEDKDRIEEYTLIDIWHKHIQCKTISCNGMCPRINLILKLNILTYTCATKKRWKHRFWK